MCPSCDARKAGCSPSDNPIDPYEWRQLYGRRWRTIAAILSSSAPIIHNIGMKKQSKYYGHRFLPDIISHTVWLYHRFTLSFRDIEDLLAERGITLTYETARQWCLKFGLDTLRKR